MDLILLHTQLHLVLILTIQGDLRLLVIVTQVLSHLRQERRRVGRRYQRIRANATRGCRDPLPGPVLSDGPLDLLAPVRRTDILGVGCGHCPVPDDASVREEELVSVVREDWAGLLRVDDKISVFILLCDPHEGAFVEIIEFGVFRRVFVTHPAVGHSVHVVTDGHQRPKRALFLVTADAFVPDCDLLAEVPQQPSEVYAVLDVRNKETVLFCHVAHVGRNVFELFSAEKTLIGL